MATHRFDALIYHNSFGEHPVACRLASGDKVITATLDAHGYDRRNERSVEFSNPLVGPFYIEGLEPGQTLSVTLEKIVPNRRNGWSYSMPLPVTVEAGYSGSLAARCIINWKVDLGEKMARLAEPPNGLAALAIPCRPMLGCIGVAPGMGRFISSYSSGDFGGNMDCPLFTSGSRIELPVFVEGGLFFIGDCHAAQCHGEITGGAIEISGSVHFSVKIKQNGSIRWPHGENEECIFTVGCARPLDLALQHATTELHRWLVGDYHFSSEAAGILMSQAISYVIGNAVSPNFSVACVLPKAYLLAATRKNSLS